MIAVDGIRSRMIAGVNGLAMHVLESGDPKRPCVMLLHGFPELAFSWRYVMPRLAAAGFYAVAPDQRGYGDTTGWDDRYDGDLSSFRFSNLVRDATALTEALGVRRVAAVVGHDFGSPVAGCCALMRPDLFAAVVCMSGPFAAVPVKDAAFADLAKLDPPRKHYTDYYGTREANGDMLHAPRGLHAFLRAYFHMKSADWPGNRPFELRSNDARELAKMPRYYVMDAAATMPDTVAAAMPSEAEIAACTWLPERDLEVYVDAFARTGFQGGLQWYRCRSHASSDRELQAFAGQPIAVPAAFIGGRRDWGVRQHPGSLHAMETTACTDYRGTHLIEHAGHWVQQERPEAAVDALVSFLNGCAG